MIFLVLAIIFLSFLNQETGVKWSEETTNQFSFGVGIEIGMSMSLFELFKAEAKASFKTEYDWSRTEAIVKHSVTKETTVVTADPCKSNFPVFSMVSF